MLEKVCSAIRPVRFRARACVYPHADGAGLGVRGVFGCDLGGDIAVSRPSTSASHIAVGQWLTVKPLERVVLSVVLPWETGVAKLLIRPGWPRLTALMALLARRPCCRLNANLRDAIVS